MSFLPIQDYGVVGDLHTVALIGINGSVDFLCYPRFDSPTIFAALLDPDRGGSFQLSPEMDDAAHKQLYLPDSNILLTRFLSTHGVAEVSDFMPLESPPRPGNLVRRAKSVRGRISFRMVFQPRFNYGRSDHRVQKTGDGWVFSSEGPDAVCVRLRSTVPLRLRGGAAVAEFKLRAEEHASFILEDATPDADNPAAAPHYVSEAFKATMNYWRNWISHCRYQGRWRETVHRSAMVLKLLTYAPEGSIVAAPTFSLPEEIGGVRNWDYRYTWIRDSAFALQALMRLGFTEEATAFMNWIEKRCGDCTRDRPLQVLYGIEGRRDLDEEVLQHFEGYKRSRPVRIGNAAHRQLQLDIYGELMDAIHQYNHYGEPISYQLWTQLRTMIDWVAKVWRKPDESIWEVRSGPQEFLFSKIMCWVALDRGIRLAGQRSFPAPLERWLRLRDSIFNDVYEHYWNPALRTFVQYRGAKTLDASTLMMPMVGFISPRDPRWRSTLDIIQKRLVEDSLVYRYHVFKGHQDGLPGSEGTFSMCSFWNVDALTGVGDLRQARFVFEKALGFANHLGLFSEELGQSGEHLGNFPQVFTHAALINAAWSLDQRLSVSEPV